MDYKRSLKEIGAFVLGHFVGTSGEHLDIYFSKEKLYPHPSIVENLCYAMAHPFAGDKLGRIETVVSFGKIGALIGHHVARKLLSPTHDIVPVFAEKEGDNFVFRYDYGELVAGRKILIADDVVTTGGSVKKAMDAITKLKGTVVGITCLVNRRDVSPSFKCNGRSVHFRSVVRFNSRSWNEADCPLCKQGVPVSTELGHG